MILFVLVSFFTSHKPANLTSVCKRLRATDLMLVCDAQLFSELTVG